MVQYKNTIVETDDLAYHLRNLSQRQVNSLRGVLEKIAESYSDDPGTSDLDSDQPCYSISFNLGEVRLVRGLLR